jgi:hypothetical protein
MNKNERFNYLLQLYLADTISIEEHDEFFHLIDSHEYDDLLGQSILHDLTKGFGNSTGDLPPHIAQEIVRNIYKSEKNTAKILPLQQKPKQLWRWMAAASLILIAASLYFFSYHNSKTKERFALLIPASTVVKENTSDKPKKIILSDGSAITLSPKSIIHYLASFNSSQREVYLEGAAFFQVAKNPEKPFLVYYNNIVTKVLGTSFTINTNQKTGNIEVSVKTGRVQVYENEKIIKNNPDAHSVIVTPNQKAIYQIDKRLLETSLADKPEPIQNNEGNSTEKENEAFVYEQEKVGNIFKQLEKAYGIEIMVENANLNNCVFTGDVTTQDLFTKLKIICLTTNSSFEVNGTKILIKGKGCQ